MVHEKGWHRVGLGWLQDVTVQFGFLIRGNGMELDLTPDSDTGAIYIGQGPVSGITFSSLSLT